MDPKIFIFLVAVLCFLISLLLNLIQRRRSKARVARLLAKEEELLNFLMGLHTSLGKVESACTFEMEGTRSPRPVARSIRIARNQIQSTVDDVQKSLRTFREYRRKEKAKEIHRKRIEKLRKKRLGR